MEPNQTKMVSTTTDTNIKTNSIPQSLTGKDVTDFSKDVGKDIVKQSLVWTFAGLVTQGLRGIINKVTKK